MLLYLDTVIIMVPVDLVVRLSNSFCLCLLSHDNSHAIIQYHDIRSHAVVRVHLCLYMPVLLGLLDQKISHSLITFILIVM